MSFHSRVHERLTHQRREVLLPVPEVVLQVIAPVLEHIEALVFDLPS
jgi:hypothetical protein